MGGRGSSAVAIKGMTSNQLKTLKNKYANFQNGPNVDMHKRALYMKYQSAYQSALSRETNKSVSEAKKRNKNGNTLNKEKFVNSFGEATNRYITSNTYERQLKRNEREIQRRMSGR